MDYLNIETLLSLQKEPSDRVHSDELVFQVIHQSFELWCLVAIEAMDELGPALTSNDVPTVLRTTQRITTILEQQVNALGILDTLRPADFHVIRTALEDGSGSQSPGFRELLGRGPALETALLTFLAARDLDEKKVLMPNADPEAQLVTDAVMSIDQAMQHWRQRHVTLVLRQIGLHVNSLQNAPVEGLAQEVKEFRYLPKFWDARAWLTDGFGQAMLNS